MEDGKRGGRVERGGIERVEKRERWRREEGTGEDKGENREWGRGWKG